jgi:hypothetical protein
VDSYHAKTQRIVTKWLNGAYPNHVTIRQSHTEKKKTPNRTIELLREIWSEGLGNLAAVGLRFMNFEKMLNAEGTSPQGAFNL